MVKYGDNEGQLRDIKLNQLDAVLAGDTKWVKDIESDRVAVMYLGRVVESGTTEEVIGNPQHPYTRSLLSVVPTPFPRRDLKREILQGELPDASNIPTGCRFHPRCPAVFDRCSKDDPRALIPVPAEATHAAACWRLDEGS